LDLAPAADWQEGWHLRAALTVLELQGIVRRDAGEIVPHPGGVAIFPRGASRSEQLPEILPLFWRWASSYGSAHSVKVLPGTTLERYIQGNKVLALVVVQSGGGGEADRRSAWRSWWRDRDWEELAGRLGIPDLERLEVSRRGPSGRVIGLVAEGRSGSRKDVQGFPIRRALDLPENLFTFHTMTRPDGSRVVRFLGRSWGHGVGLCQNGAYGLARSGLTYDRILRHYYSGVDLIQWRPQ
jgi:stage II sporulation protein D